MAAARPWVKYLALGCGGLLVVAVAVVAVIFVTVSRLTAAPEQVARDFLAATSRGDFAAAHAYFAAPLKEKQPLSALEAVARETPSIFKVADVWLIDALPRTASNKVMRRVLRAQYAERAAR